MNEDSLPRREEDLQAIHDGGRTEAKIETGDVHNTEEREGKVRCISCTGKDSLTAEPITWRMGEIAYVRRCDELRCRFEPRVPADGPVLSIKYDVARW